MKEDYCRNYSPNDSCKKPPIGLTPRKIHNERRMSDIINAMKRYSNAGVEIPQEWIDELSELNNG